MFHRPFLSSSNGATRRQPRVSDSATLGYAPRKTGPLKEGEEAGLIPRARSTHHTRVPQSLASLLVHLVFSTKGREPLLSDELRDDLHGYIGGIVGHHSGTLLAAGSVTDHIHLFISHPRTIAPSDLVKEIKMSSSKWIKARDKRLASFHWQHGYGMFSISPAHREALEKYIANQAEHHRTTTFQEEYRKLLSHYGMEWDERYVWD